MYLNLVLNLMICLLFRYFGYLCKIIISFTLLNILYLILATNIKVTAVTTSSVLEQQINVTSKPTQAFQRVIQTIPANVTIATQQTGIKVISSNQPAPTAIVVNILFLYSTIM